MSQVDFRAHAGHGVTRRALLAALCALPAAGFGQSGWPDHPITLLIPLQAGSAGDILLRVVAERLSQSLQQGVVVENQAGASGLTGAERVSRAPPNGYLIGGISDSVLNFAANLVEKVSFDPVGDFEPITLVADVSWVLVANPKLGVTNLQQLIDLAKAHPGSIDFASAGPGSPHQIAMEMLERKAGIQLTHVPYKGASQALIDVASGQVPLMFSATSVALPFVRDGKLVALGVPSTQRSTLLPEVPTLAEAGLKDFHFATWVALYGPKGLPAPIVARLNEEVRKALDDPGIRDKLVALGLEPHPTTPAELGILTARGHEDVRRIIREAGIKPE